MTTKIRRKTTAKYNKYLSYNKKRVSLQLGSSYTVLNYHEFGTVNIPARAPLRNFFDSNKQYLITQLHVFSHLLFDNKNYQHVLQQIDTKFIDYIMSSPLLPLKPATIAQKTQNKTIPLVHYKTAINSVRTKLIIIN